VLTGGCFEPPNLGGVCKGGGTLNVSINNKGRRGGRRGKSDLIYVDLSQGVPLRKNVLDAAISVAAIHYLCCCDITEKNDKKVDTQSHTEKKNEKGIIRLLRYPILNNNFCYNFFKHIGESLDTEEKIANVIHDSLNSLNLLDSTRFVKDFPHQGTGSKYDSGERSFVLGINLNKINASLSTNSISNLPAACLLFEHEENGIIWHSTLQILKERFNYEEKDLDYSSKCNFRFKTFKS